MGETVWYRIVGQRRVKREDVLPARSGRFHHDPATEPTSYLGESLLTVWKEAQAARAGQARVNLDAFAGWRITIRDARFVDFREAAARKDWNVTEAELFGVPAPPRCIEVARALRHSGKVIHGLLYGSVRNPPAGLCLALFLEVGSVVSEIDRVSEKDWTKFAESLSPAKE
jgi:hypothetical protein